MNEKDQYVFAISLNKALPNGWDNVIRNNAYRKGDLRVSNKICFTGLWF